MLSKAEEALTKLVSRHQGDIKVRHRDKALRALDLAGSPPLLFGSAILFLLIAWDVFGGTSKFPIQSYYLLPHYIDWPVHAWVKRPLTSCRIRPSDVKSSFAFPSGHTTFSVFVIGALLYVILPLCVAGPEGDTEGGDLNAREGRLLDALVSTVQVSALPIWILGGLVTASGRILADVHWVSDTMGGACLGVFMVSAAAYVCKAVRA
ncbi:hypothetical protein COCSUDRAFT_58438 [Coccomyxa subellipsoidea C-169]|uniref:Phosphatidic acid phosphatase type 2/haloperoxidase domain-containing protein n=1 Tax=Coccomyxa subellipsoidea (strain C-169) TaxID=574566 RepID=I0YMT6_COCSC|nr:hypothetical protein COCSUDRAFT_58438 [Coccomyxa subellipsoidea C-169]EIE19705.1 hypothetical protein COCSUDRAFT_58438 [Coccomyxa subellipsoidea C-169]|eukprot:XP_005644249.1 hypothetical protein COCSUDRAFT_58438 [Coccomyxa subellipsoidea C-169]